MCILVLAVVFVFFLQIYHYSPAQLGDGSKWQRTYRMDQTWCFVYSSTQKDGKVIYHHFGMILMDFTSFYSSISGVDPFSEMILTHPHGKRQVPAKQRHWNRPPVEAVGQNACFECGFDMVNPMPSNAIQCHGCHHNLSRSSQMDMDFQIWLLLWKQGGLWGLTMVDHRTTVKLWSNEKWPMV